jgi:hypothetical protein
MLRAVLFCVFGMRRFARRMIARHEQPALTSEFARRQASPIERNVVGAALRQAELPLLKFSANLDKALLLSLVQGLQAGALRRRLPIDTDGGMQQNQDLDNGISPWLTHAATMPPGSKGLSAKAVF